MILGVDDNKKLIGIEEPVTIEEKLTSLIADSIAPLLLPTIKIATIDDKSLLIIEVPHVSHLGPCYLQQKGKEQGIMVR